MDIDTAVARMIELSKEIDQAVEHRSSGNDEAILLLAEEMAQVWDGIDQWIVRRGVMPERWIGEREDRIERAGL